MLVYDFKYPDLARITYHHYVKNRKQLNGHQFHMINLNHLEYSRRINPLKPEYIPTLADASETAEALIEALRKTDRTTGSGSVLQSVRYQLPGECHFLFHQT
jgi:hypothetical protein